MRWWCTLILAGIFCGCGGTTAPPAKPYGLDLTAALGPTPPTAAGVSISTVHLHLTQVTAVSDRTSTEPRARVAAIELGLGATVEQPLPSAPPGLYSGVELALGDSMTPGVDLEGAWNGLRLHVSLTGGPIAVFCSAPQALELGHRARLELSTDLSGWLDGVDLSSATSDSDDNGILVSFEDNAPLAKLVWANATNSFQVICDTW